MMPYFALVISLFICTSCTWSIKAFEECFYQNSINSKSITAKEFDVKSEICCLESGIHNKIDEDGDEIECCGKGTYKKRMEVCCRGKPYPKRDDHGRHRICCGSKLHNVSKGDRCCGDHLLSSGNLGCCDGEQYNRKQYYCKDKQIIKRGFGICGRRKSLYDISTHSCCNGRLHNKPKRKPRQKQMYECCGSDLYDVTNEHCCSPLNSPHIQPRERGCCGKSHYDKSTEICCREKVYKDLPNITCCGSKTFNTSFQECCGSEVINRSVQSCCGGQVLDADKECCGSTVYRGQGHICCNNKKLIKKNKPQHNSCCSSNQGQYSYDNTAEQCKMFPSEQSTDCGQMGQFNAKEDLCCNGQKHRGAKLLGQECCLPGHHVYQPKTQICCYSIPTVKTKNGCDSNYRQITTSSSVTSSSKEKKTNPTKKPVHGICSICSWKPKLYSKLRIAIREKTFDICRKSAMMVDILSLVQKNDKLKRTILKVQSYKNLYKEDDPLGNQFIYTLIVPCSCKRLQKMRFKKFVLITDIDFRKKTLYLGDADTLIPVIKNIPRMIKKRSKSCKFHLVSKLLSLLKDSKR